MRKIFFVILSALLLSSCGSSKRNKVVTKRNKITVNRNYKTAAVSPKATNIIKEARKYEGTRYKYGGDNKRGIDCSGLIMNAFQSENIALPRTTSALSSTGNWIDLKEVQEGDLMFFATRKNSRKVNHVAIVTEARPGFIEFIHSTTSKGVIRSTLDEKYWYFAFVQARRVL